MLQSSTLNNVGKASAVKQFDHMLRQEERNLLKKALNFKVCGHRKYGMLKSTYTEKDERRDFKKICLTEE